MPYPRQNFKVEFAFSSPKGFHFGVERISAESAKEAAKLFISTRGHVYPDLEIAAVRSSKR